MSPSDSLFFVQPSAIQRSTPPTKIGVEDDNGRYTPTANGKDGTRHSSSTRAMPTPSRTRPHGSLLVMMPSMIKDISRALGALYLRTEVPSRRVVSTPLMPGSTRYLI